MSDKLLQEAHGEPTCIAIVLCNDVVIDEDTQAKTLVRLFDTIEVPKIPDNKGKFCTMVSLTEGQGRHHIRISVRAPSGREIAWSDGDLFFESANDVYDLTFTINGMRLLEAGHYFVDLIVDGSLKAQRRFGVICRQGNNS